ncbi:putative ABC transporter ATP-binding protein [uncultured archaeon]|nr:putative ABC transporter ATP-binding protein [uncultured archaeon]
MNMSQSIAAAADDSAISLRGLTKRFGDLVAVDSVNLEIAKGELFGLLGPNGAGKTTLIKMLTTMLRPTEGEARVWGHNVAKERNEVRSSIGVVFQDPSIDNMLTGRENLDFHGRMYGMDGSLRKKRIDEVLELVDLTDKANIKMEDYSGGMQRRLEIARGLMHHPKVLFLDEPTLGLDAQTRRYIWKYVEEMNAREGVTIVLTTHYMEEADYLCDRVAIIDNGRIVALDTPKNLKDLIGADTITLEVQSGSDALIQSLKSFDWIKSIATSNGTIELRVDHAQARIPEVMIEAYKNKTLIKSVGLHEPTLEDVLLKFTGKKIREAEGAGNPMRAMAMMHRRKG